MITNSMFINIVHSCLFHSGMLNDQSLIENLFGHNTSAKDNSLTGEGSPLSLRERVRLAKEMYNNPYNFNQGQFEF